MFDLTTLDYVYIGLILVSTVWASIRGGVYETVATLSWVIAAIAARFVSPLLDGLFQSWFKLPESTIGTLVASYFIVFFVILVIFGLFNQKLRDRIQESMLSVTDHTFGIVFGIIRGIVVMGAVYWGLLWYYSDTALPSYITTARTRPVMQLTAKKLHDWFIPGENKLLERDITGMLEAQQLYDNLINPAVQSAPESIRPIRRGESEETTQTVELDTEPAEVGYKDSERKALDNQLLQIESKNEE
ncbi:MAG: CvpA family protein [Alphaproteobacteria bacterium]|nr:CvpA family protein [Alphaproteobacteria bacterium]